MMDHIPESDWKLLRKLQPALLERFCEPVLQGVCKIAMSSNTGHHQRYLEVFEYLHAKDREMAMAFNDWRRSVAIQRLSTIYSYGLMNEEEFAQFSEETRTAIKWWTTTLPEGDQ